MKTAAVVIEKATAIYDRVYDYLLPPSMQALPGCRVLVPFGGGNQTRVGLVLAFNDAGPEQDRAKLKQARFLLDREPLLNEEGLALLGALRERTLCTWWEALRALIPPGTGVRLSTGLTAVRGLDAEEVSPEAARLYAHLLTRRRLTDENTALAALGLAPGHPAADELVGAGLARREQLVKKRIVDERAVMARLCSDKRPAKPTPKQRAVLELLEQVGCASVKELCYFCGVGKTVVERLRGQDILELFEEVVARPAPAPAEAPAPALPIALSRSQQDALDVLLKAGETPGAVSLLYGVTGSGKTQVFLRLIEETLAKGLQAVVLIPEISLTPQTAGLFLARFGNRVAVLHSSLSMGERLEEWRRIREGGADIVVGTRSAVFAPLQNLGLIVIDEEQEHTYHSESAPRYHARDIARMRVRTHGGQLVLCSATPSVESYHAAKTGRYALATLTERYSGNALPEVVTVDMRTAPLAAGSIAISEELSEQLLGNLERGEQSILLLNRRGYSTLVKCSACGETVRCPHCSIPLTHHAANNRLLCHYCGYSIPVPSACLLCQSPMLRCTGAGTQRAEQELAALFPTARVLRMDADTTMSRFAHQKAFDAFSRGGYDIMIGTQMVAKGHDFPRVTLVGVLCADQSLYTDDFRGFERTFSLVTQVVGRCGRAGLPGRAYIQTFSPESAVLALAARQDYPAFFEEEIAFRRVGLYPPFCDLACLMVSGEKEGETVQMAQALRDRFVLRAAEEYAGMPLRLIGPAEASPYRAAGRYRMRILIKCRNTAQTRTLFAELRDWFAAQRSTASLSIDLHYE